MGKEDYVVICGDFGGVWHTDRKSAAESPEEAQALDWLENRPFTTLFISGNHENYDRLMPSVTEREYGLYNIHAFMKQHDRLDFVFTHDAPASDKSYLGYDGTDELNRYFESLRDEMKYGYWFYGHLHENRRVMDNHYLLYEQIVRVC